MELGHILASQIIFFSSIIGAITVAEYSGITLLLKHLCSMPFIRVTGEKGAIFLLISFSIVVLFSVNFIASQAKLYKLKQLRRRAKLAAMYQFQNTFIAFVSFISAYIFQSLTFRVYNLLGLLFILVNIKCIVTLCNLKLLTTWIYFYFMVCNMLIFCFVFVRNFEGLFSFAASILKLRFR